MFKTLIADPLPPDIEGYLETLGKVVKVGEENKERRILEEIGDADIICIRTATKMDKPMIDLAKKLKYILTFTIGTDHIDMAYAKERAIEVISDVRGGTTDAVAEHVIGLMIDLVRKISYSNRKTKENEWVKKECMGTELNGKTLGIIGCGKIGTRIAQIAKLGFAMNVIGYDPFIKEHNMVSMTGLKEVLAQSDIITLHVPETKETVGMIGKDEFDLMAKGRKPYLINAARGKLIQSEELYTALTEGKIKGIALDVYPEEPPFEDPVYQKIKEMGNVVLTPHIAGSTHEGKLKIGRNVIEQLKARINRGVES